MAKKKTEQTVVDEENVVVEAAESKQEVKEEPAPKNEDKAEVKAEVKAETKLPDYAVNLCKTFSNYPELMISPQGGVYMPGSKLAVEKGAILYKNPYYKN